MKWTIPAAALAAALSMPACGAEEPAVEAGSTDTVAAADTLIAVPAICSAASLDPALPAEPELPMAVAATRAAIAHAAVACDYAALDSIAASPDFTYSFGDGLSAGEFWREAEDQGEKPLWMLVRSLALPWIREQDPPEDLPLYIWPSAYRLEPTEEDWAALEGVYSIEEIEAYRDIGFIGWRAGIAEDGEWRFFVAGD
ncbi:MAG TPA: hypothetical protein VM778_13650 [Gemmatimonadota bacterium]|nr:hypothetical protein [Gemmatimonadota bacterium]